MATSRPTRRRALRWRGSSPQATCTTTDTARRSRRPASAAWRRSTPNGGWRNRNLPPRRRRGPGSELRLRETIYSMGTGETPETANAEQEDAPHRVERPDLHLLWGVRRHLPPQLHLSGRDPYHLRREDLYPVRDLRAGLSGRRDRHRVRADTGTDQRCRT